MPPPKGLGSDTDGFLIAFLDSLKLALLLRSHDVMMKKKYKHLSDKCGTHRT